MINMYLINLVFLLQKFTKFSFFQLLGPRSVGSNALLIPLTILYLVIFISGVAGNVAVCLVIVKNKSMHTATNYYLFSLAVSDLMILIFGKWQTTFS